MLETAENSAFLAIAMFADASSRQEKNEALRTSRKRVFGVPLPPELRLLQGVPHTQHRRQLWQRPHRQVEIPLDSRHKMQDLRRDAIQHGAGEVSGRLLRVQ